MCLCWWEFAGRASQEMAMCTHAGKHDDMCKHPAKKGGSNKR